MHITLFDWALISLRWVHLFFGVMWLGHLYFLNFSQSQLSPADSGRFRFSALGTMIAGLLYLMIRGHQVKAAGLFGSSWGIFILIGSATGLLMWLNAWFVMRPAANMTAVTQERIARTSRTNLLLSFPLLFFMEAASHLPLNLSESPKLGLLGLLIVVILGALELNALKGKMGPLKSLVGAIHIGVILTLVLLGLCLLLL